MTIRRAKAKARQNAIARVLAMRPAERAGQQAALVSLFAVLPGFAQARTVMLYVSAFPEEIETLPLFQVAREMRKRVICPRVNSSDRRLELFPVEDPESDLEPGVLGILEPRRSLNEISVDLVDWVLVPGLEFDERGGRLGRGMGYYDRLLASLPPSVPTWALAFDAQWVDQVPIEPHDRPVRGVASPSRQVDTQKLSKSASDFSEPRR